MADKMRVHILAKELNVSSKTIIEKCKAEGIASVKNHMSTLSAGLHATILEWFTDGAHESALETAERIDLDKVRIRRRKKAAPAQQAGAAVAEATAPGAPAESTTAVAEPEAPLPAEETVSTEQEDEAHAAFPEVLRPAAEVVEPTAPAEAQPSLPVTVAAEAPPAARELTTVPDARMEAPSEVVAPEVPPAEAVRERAPVAPAGPQHVPAPARLQGPRVVRYEAPDYQQPRAPLRPRPASEDEAAAAARGRRSTEYVKEPEKETVHRPARGGTRRQANRLAEAGERLAEWRDQDLLERQERLAGATGRRMSRRRTVQAASAPSGQTVTVGPKTQTTVREPVLMKELCAALGVSFMQLFKLLRDEHNIVGNINMVLPTDVAELLALHFGIELTVVPAKTQLDDLKDEFAARELAHLQLRPPVVAMLGHVDHGKTSLLDAIRRTRIAAGEDGGITQHISSYHVRSARGAVTFLDTPGHEAFTAMRARGAQITDIVVLVVAVDDGLMPQTIEAINHAKAAQVTIVVALNKIDLGTDRKLQIFGQLTEQGLTPSGEWGGEVDVLETSAKTGQGVSELVEHLADLASILDLKADPTVPACGTVIEAETRGGVGPVARVLVRDGTLRVGEFVVCGSAAGKVRALLSDDGARLEEAGPSLPVEVWGLDDVPASGDGLYVVESMQRAKEIAAEVKEARVSGGRQHTRKAKSLQEMLQQRDSQEVPELNVVLKADTDGSVAALKQALGRLPTDEVRLTLRHAGVGPVNDSDVLLASTCDGAIVAFRVDVSVGARRLCDVHGVEVRSHRVIYDVCDEIKKALEGLLAPEIRIETRATVEVREVFHLGKKLGVVAGCFVTSGQVERRHSAKVSRDGVVVREGASIASLRRYKDDVREVRAGLECGLRLEGFDDVHVGDIITTYEVIKTARTL